MRNKLIAVGERLEGKSWNLERLRGGLAEPESFHLLQLVSLFSVDVIKKKGRG